MAPGVWNLGTQKCSCGGAYGKCPGDREPATLCKSPACSKYHERVRTQGQQLQQLQAELDKLHKEVSGVRTANSEVSPAPQHPLTAWSQGCSGAPPAAQSLPLETPF